MHAPSRLTSGRWLAAGIAVSILAGFTFILTSQGDDRPAATATIMPVARAETLAPRPLPSATAGFVSPTASPTVAGELPTATKSRAATVITTQQVAPANQPPATVTATSEPTIAPTAPLAATETPVPLATQQQLPACEVECVEVGVTLENFPGPMSAISDFGALSGRMPDMVMFFQAWGDADAPFKPWLPDLAGLEVAPLITWEPWRRSEFLNQSEFSLQSILAGHHDAYIDDWAQRAAVHGNTIYLRFAHEMNTPPGEVQWYPWQGDPETYVAAWRYVHDRFEVAGATNVEWVWSVAWMNVDAPLYYPGDEYVDWVGVTVLNFGTTVEGPGWRSFATLYTETDGGMTQSERARTFGKPVMVTEIASVEQGGDKGQWIAELAPALRDQFPEIRAIIWNNFSQARHQPEASWAVDSSPEALAGWQALMSDPYVTSPAARMRITWARTDRPVALARAARTWMWGPQPFTDLRDEPYAEAPSGARTVCYYDKSRMEITYPGGPWTSPWYVTNGLLATELITGRLQTGDGSFEQRSPAEVNAAGDLEDPAAPTYASFTNLLGEDGVPAGTVLAQRLNRDGTVVDDPALADHDARAAYLVPETGHTVAGPFWTFMNATGMVWEFGQYVEEPIFENPFFATGLPITEAYWVTVTVGGNPRDVLVQCFERRCLTFTPENPEGWQVEAGNVGRHYYAWRYE